MTTDNESLPPGPAAGPRSNIIFEAAAFTSLMVAVLSLFLFAWIGDGVAHDRTAGFDLAIRNQVHAYASPPLTKAMIFISFLGGDGLTAAAILSVIAFLVFHWRREALWMVVTILGALVLDLSLKYAFHRPRPVPFFVPVPYTYSFPSGHSLFSFCFYGVLAGLLTRRIRSPMGRVLIWTLAAVLVAAIGLSRVYLGVHYPSDVIAGYLAASLWVSTLVALDRVRVELKDTSNHRT
ncbi:MAG: phosphatase PAP2 family protein [Terriglobales bacterium]